jgi:hypothetical protein
MSGRPDVNQAGSDAIKAMVALERRIARSSLE